MGTAGVAKAQIYYVNALSGSDSNSGTSPTSAWASLTPASGTTFAPGSQILLADGQNWYGTLNVASSGTNGDPITYGSYLASNSPNNSNPTIWGSDIIPSPTMSFTGIANVGGDETYTYSDPTTINSFLVNHQFTHSSALVSGISTSDPNYNADNVTYVENNPDTWYYDSTNGGTLYANPGAPISSSNVYTVATRQNVITVNLQSNVVIQNINTAETAASNGGYGIYVQSSSNVTVQNLSVTGAGKHGVAALDANNFLGQNISASNFMPDQGYGGSTAFVAYSDYNVPTPTTSTWINDSFTQANGPYPAFITHYLANGSMPNPVGSVIIKNLTTDGSGLGVVADTVASGETVQILGGNIAGAIQVSGNNVLINGVKLTPSAYANAYISLAGNNNVVQNNIITGAQSNWAAGQPGAIIDQPTGTAGNVVRYNTIVMDPGGPASGTAFALMNPNSTSQFYANIVETPNGAILEGTPGSQTAQLLNNLYFLEPSGSNSTQALAAGTPVVVYDNEPNVYTALTSWTDDPNSTSAIYGDPMFTSDGSYGLMPGSPAIDAFEANGQYYVAYDYYGNPRYMGLTDLGAVVPEPASLTLLGAASLLVLRRRVNS
jgi:hypothetical protein